MLSSYLGICLYGLFEHYVTRTTSDDSTVGRKSDTDAMFEPLPVSRHQLYTSRCKTLGLFVGNENARALITGVVFKMVFGDANTRVERESTLFLFFSSSADEALRYFHLGYTDCSSLIKKENKYRYSWYTIIVTLSHAVFKIHTTRRLKRTIHPCQVQKPLKEV